MGTVHRTNLIWWTSKLNISKFLSLRNSCFFSSQPSVSELQSVIPRYALVAWILYFFWALVIVLTPDAGLSHALVIVRDLLWEASLLTGLTATCRVAMIIVSSSMLAIKMSDTESTNQLRNFFIALMIVLFVLFIIALALMAAYDLYFYYAAVYLFALGISFLVITAVSWYFLVQVRVFVLQFQRSSFLVGVLPHHLVLPIVAT